MARQEESLAVASSEKTYRILVIGGCYAGLAAATNLLDLCNGRAPRFAPTQSITIHRLPIEVTIVDERDGFFHVIGSPLSLADENYASKAWVRFRNVPGLQHPAIKFVHGSVPKVDTSAMKASIVLHGETTSFQQEYDYLVAASGRSRIRYLEEAQRHIDAVHCAQHGVIVIGGGAVGIEMAAELKVVEPSQKVTLIHSRDKLLSSEPLSDNFKDETLALLRSIGVEVITGQRVRTVSEADSNNAIPLSLSNNTTLTTSHVINAISRSVPTTAYLPPETLDPEGYVLVSPTMNFLQTWTPNFRHHFAAGDIAAWSGIKRCGAAMHMGHYVAQNIYQHILSTRIEGYECEYKMLSEHPPMIGLALGSTAISCSPTEGVKKGEEVLKYIFGDDLGFSICWNYMRLGEKSQMEEASLAEAVANPTAVVEGVTELKLECKEVEGASSSSSSEGESPHTPVDNVIDPFEKQEVQHKLSPVTVKVEPVISQ